MDEMRQKCVLKALNFASTFWGLQLDMFSRPETTDEERLDLLQTAKERLFKVKGEEVNRRVQVP